MTISSGEVARVACLPTTWGVLAVLFTFIAIRRLYFSSLSSIPGPSLAALTGVWLYVRDIQGRGSVSIKQAHDRYGFIVRIGPNEVSINDVEIHNQIYRQATPFKKAPQFYDVFASPTHNMFSTSDDKFHSQMRRLASNNFARKQIFSMEPRIWERMDEFVGILSREYADRYTELCSAFRSLVLDLITTFAYGEAFGAMRVPGFQEDLLDAFEKFGHLAYIFLIYPPLRYVAGPIMVCLPGKLFQAIPQLVKRVNEGVSRMKQRIASEKSDPDSLGMPAKSFANSSRLGFEYSNEQLASDGIGSIIAGTDTTAAALSVGVWAIFSNETVRKKLHRELKDNWPLEGQHPQLQELEALPYLRACIRESLRLATPIRGRLPRIVPAGGIQCGNYFLPRGTVVSSSPYLLHYNETIFPEPRRFDPERWLEKDPTVSSLRDQHYAPYSVGSRQCVGLNLAQAELFITMATILRKFVAEDVQERQLKIRERFGTSIRGGLPCQVKAYRRNRYLIVVPCYESDSEGWAEEE